jgi:NADP-dependent 3-hydroxy acid dehydrogenase YdfG
VSANVVSAPSVAASGEAPLAGRVAVVTGASRGIGLAVATALVQAGARVAMLARGEQELAARASELGERTIVIPCDVGDLSSVERAVLAIRARLGTADLIVNNAGIFRLATLEATSVEEFEMTLRVNLLAPFAILRAFVAPMRAQGRGHVVTIGSIADRMTFPENGAYAATKYGARAMHEVLRGELRGSGVRATLVSPAAVDTPLWDPIDPDSRAGFTPRAQMLAPGAVADAVLWAVTRPESVNVDELRLSRS